MKTNCQIFINVYLTLKYKVNPSRFSNPETRFSLYTFTIAGKIVYKPSRKPWDAVHNGSWHNCLFGHETPKKGLKIGECYNFHNL